MGNSNHKTIKPTAEEIFRNFEILPFRIERIFFKHWFILVILAPYLCLVVLGALYALIDHTFPKLYMPWASNIFTDGLFFIIILVLTLSSFTYIDWYKRIPATFQQFLEKDRLMSRQADGNVVVEYMEFMGSYQKYLWSKWRYVLIGLIFSFYIFFMLTVKPYTTLDNATNNSILGVIGFIYITVMYVLFPVISLYLIGAAFWTLIATGQYINKLHQEFILKIQPSHPDRSGGLKNFGDFSFRLALPLLMTIVSMGLIILFIVNVWGITNESDRMVTLLIIFLPLVLAGTYIAFLGPIWGIHLQMKETKNEYEEEYADQLGVVQNKLRAYLDEKDLERAAEAKKELEILYALSPENVSYPAWPFDTQVLVKFLMPQIIPFLSFVAGIESDAGKDMLLEFLSAFFGG